MDGLKALSLISAGVVIGVLATKRYYMDKYRKLAEEEFAAAKDIVNKVKGSKEDSNDGNQKIMTSYDIDEKNENVEKMVQAFDYSNVPKLEKDEDKGKEEEDMKRHDKPYIIDDVDFDDTDLNYDKDSLDYYIDDDSLVNTDGDLMEDIDEYVGRNNLDVFATDIGRDVLYVRNDKYAVDYEIIKYKGGYKEVTGV